MRQRDFDESLPTIITRPDGARETYSRVFAFGMSVSAPSVQLIPSSYDMLSAAYPTDVRASIRMLPSLRSYAIDSSNGVGSFFPP